MTKEDFIEKLKIDGKIITSRCSEKYLKKHDLYDWLINNTTDDFITVKEKIRFILYGGGYCRVCNKRTNISNMHEGFADYCKEHFHEPKKNKLAHNRSNVDLDLIKKLYYEEINIIIF